MRLARAEAERPCLSTDWREKLCSVSWAQLVYSSKSCAVSRSLHKVGNRVVGVFCGDVGDES